MQTPIANAPISILELLVIPIVSILPFKLTTKDDTLVTAFDYFQNIFELKRITLFNVQNLALTI
tara:strand:- start:854 stop:1045 length:192 start_codon:yes stop_codon:yes gene_type:complete